MAILTLTLNACAAKNDDETPKKDSKVLVAYFSAQGHTKAVAKTLAEITGGTLFEIKPAVPYTDSDLNWRDEQSRSSLEMKDRSSRPEIKNKVNNFAQYDTIYLGFPIWWYTAPVIVNTFLEQYNTSGKVIIPFATSGGSEYGNTEKDLQVSAPKAIFKPGKVLTGMNKKELKAWTESL